MAPEISALPFSLNEKFLVILNKFLYISSNQSSV